MSHIINTCSCQTGDRGKQSQLGEEEREQILDHMDLSTLSSLNGNLSQSKSMQVSELIKTPVLRLEVKDLLMKLNRYLMYTKETVCLKQSNFSFTVSELDQDFKFN